MTQEVKEILRELKGHTGGNAANQFEPMARLLVLICEEQAKSADKLEKQTSQLICLTRALVLLSVGLLIFTIALCMLH